MYFIFNTSNGSFTVSNMDGVVRATDANANTVQALEKLEPGEYCYVGSYVIVRSGGGTTIDRLNARHW